MNTLFLPIIFNGSGILMFLKPASSCYKVLDKLATSGTVYSSMRCHVPSILPCSDHSTAQNRGQPLALQFTVVNSNDSWFVETPIVENSTMKASPRFLS